MRRYAIIIPAALVIAILVWTGYSLLRERRKLEADITSATDAARKLENENSGLQEKIRYFSLPENMVKELKARYNYKVDGEKMIIVVPKSASSTQ